MAVAGQLITDDYAIYNADCIEVMQGLPDESVHASIYSPPFGGLYHYSSDNRDLSNARNYAEFFEHYEYVIREKYRLTIPGRTSGVHAALVPTGNTGADGYTDFPGDVIRAHEKIGWTFIARHVIWKEPLAVRNRTMQKNLAHKTIVDDGSHGGVAAPDELLVFRKPGGGHPAAHPNGLTGEYMGSEKHPADTARYRGWEGDQKANRWSHWIWRRYASSVWDDVRIDNVLPFQDSKDPDDEKHVHPLQLDVIARYIDLRTLPGERVLTPFMGVGSEVYQAVKMRRFAVGVELKESYYRQAVMNLDSLEGQQTEEPTLLDAL